VNFTAVLTARWLGPFVRMAEPEEGLLEPEAAFVVDGVEVNPTGQGYTAVHNYAHYFWRPYLGNTAFALWELLLSFCFGDGDTAYPSIARLARMLTNSDYSRAVVTGRRKAAQTLGVAAAKTLGVSQTPRVSRSDGALDILRRERLVQVVRQGDGQMSHYTFRVLKTLPLLRPDQLARLSSRLQHDHRVWLERRGIDPATYRQAFAAPEPSEPSTRRARTAHSAAPDITPPAAPDITPRGAADTTPSAPRTTGAAPDTGGAAPHTTNHPQEESLLNQWWEEALTELRPQLLRGTYDVCLLRTKVRSFQDGVLTLRAASPLVQDVLQHRLLPLVRRTLDEVSRGQVREVAVE
jgi:hypothetical protein